MQWLTFSLLRSVSSWHNLYRNDFGSLQSVVLVVMKLVPPTLSLTHSFLRGGEEEVEVTVTFVEAAMAARAKTGLGGVYTLLSLHTLTAGAGQAEQSRSVPLTRKHYQPPSINSAHNFTTLLVLTLL